MRNAKELERVQSTDIAEFQVERVLAAYSNRRQPLTALFQRAQRAALVPFGKWNFLKTVLSSPTKTLETALEPYDTYTRHNSNRSQRQPSRAEMPYRPWIWRRQAAYIIIAAAVGVVMLRQWRSGRFSLF